MSIDPSQTDAEAIALQARQLRRLARSLVRDFDSAEDVVQEAALRSLEGAVRPRRGVKACLSGAIRNVARSWHRAESRREAREQSGAKKEATPSTLDVLARIDEQQTVLRAVRTLDEPYRSVIWMRYFEARPPREIAKRTKRPVATVKSQLQRGLQVLRRRLDDAHGGSRKAWLTALMPLAAWRPLVDGSSLTTLGANVMNQVTAKSLAVVSVAALFIGGIVWFGPSLFDSGTGSGDAKDLSVADEGTGDAAGLEPGGAGSLRDPLTRPAVDDETAAHASGGGAAETTGGEDDTATTVKGDEDVDWDTVEPAQRRSPFGLPKRRPGRRMGGGGFGGPTGHWTRFGLAPPAAGKATLLVTVLDQDGNPIPNADVYLTPPDLVGVKGVSFGDIRKVGKTTANGTLEAEALPSGGAAVAGNINNRLNGPGGLDATTSVRVLLKDNATAQVQVTLPFSFGEMGTVYGKVLDPQGNPARNVNVIAGYNQIRTSKDGTYELQGLPAGEQTISVSLWSYEAPPKTVVVKPQGRTELDFALDYKEQGTVTLRGVVVGPEGEIVPQAYVYLNSNKRKMTLRSTRSDDDGRFVFEKLAEDLRTTSVEVQAGKIPYYGSTRKQFDEGLTTEEVRLQLPVRYVDWRLTVQDAATGEPVKRCRCSAKPPEGEERRAPYLAYDREKQRYGGIAEAGRYTLVVEGLDHETIEVDVEVKPVDGVFEQEVALKRISPDTVDIHLTVLLKELGTDKPIERCKIEVLRLDGVDMARFEGGRRVSDAGAVGQAHPAYQRGWVRDARGAGRSGSEGDRRREDRAPASVGLGANASRSQAPSAGPPDQHRLGGTTGYAS